MQLTQNRLDDMLKMIPNLRIGLIGDGCVDIYWEADMRKSELSREVPHYPLPVFEERFSLGAGANVVANLAAMGAQNIRFLSVLGDDWRGGIFLKLLKKIGVSPKDLVCSDEIFTPAYCKPIRNGISNVRYEDPRIDFANMEPLPEEMEIRLLDKLEQITSEVDLLIVCDQLNHGCITQKMIKRISKVGTSLPVIVDSRDRMQQFYNVIVKPNEVELSRSLNVPDVAADRTDEVAALAASVYGNTNRPVLVTLGENGALFYEHGGYTHVPAYPVQPPIDFVGAGDAFLAGFALGYAQHATPKEAISLGCLVSSVTIKKLGVTGTASPDELRAALEARNL